MENGSIQKSQKNNFLISFLSLEGGLFLLTCANFNGVGMSPDSARYILPLSLFSRGEGF